MSRMRDLSAITESTVAARILLCLALPSRAPRWQHSATEPVIPIPQWMNHPVGLRSSTSTSVGPPATTRTAPENLATSARERIDFGALRAEVRA
jgi:hypothetical protein